MSSRNVIIQLALGSVVWAGQVTAQTAATEDASTEANLGSGADSSGKRRCYAEYENAQVARQAGRLRDARAALVVCSNTACPAAVQTDCVTWLDQVTKSLPTVVFVARVNQRDDVGVSVFMDGQPIVTRLDGKALAVDPGPHTFRFERPPFPPQEQQVLISEGEKDRQVRANFGNESEDTARVANPGSNSTLNPIVVDDYRPVPALTYVLSGLSIAGLGSFVFFGYSGKSDRDALLHRCAPFCEPDEVNPIRRKLLVADISLGVAAASALAATWAYLARPTAVAEKSAQRATQPSFTTLSRLLVAPVNGGGAVVYREVF